MKVQSAALNRFTKVQSPNFCLIRHSGGQLSKTGQRIRMIENDCFQVCPCIPLSLYRTLKEPNPKIVSASVLGVVFAK